MITITTDERKGVGTLKGRLGTAVFDLARELPGRRRWVGQDLVFELTRANIEHIQAKLPDAKWDSNHVERLERLRRLEEDARALKTSPLPPEAHKFRFKTKPRNHQLRTFAVSKDRRYFGFFLEQGLGKTKCTLDDVARLWSEGKIDTLLIWAPNNVHAQWIEEQLPVHLPDFVPHKAIIYKSEQTKKWQKQSEEVFDYQDGLRIFAMHHEALATDKGIAYMRRVLSSGKVYWAVDESSRAIKTAGSKRTKAALKLRDLAEYRRILDGTPTTRGVEDLFTQLKFLHDDVLGYSSFYTFRNRYCITQPIPGAPPGAVQIVGYRNLEELQQKMDAWSIRLTAAECLDLPERVYLTRPVELTAEQKRLYISMRDEFLAQLDDGTLITAEQAVVKLLRLQQIVCGHVKDENGVIHSVPTNRPQEALAAAEQANGKVVVWARFQHDIDLIADVFKRAKWSPVTWDGRTTNEERRAAKQRFIHNSDCRAFIGNPSAAGIGLDGLQHASHTMIYYSNTFKASERWQSEARLFRDGQQGTVNVIDLVARGTVDNHILRTLKQRKDVATRVMDIREYLTAGPTSA